MIGLMSVHDYARHNPSEPLELQASCGPGWYILTANRRALEYHADRYACASILEAEGYRSFGRGTWRRP